MSKSWWVDDHHHRHCTPDFAGTCNPAHLRASGLHDRKMARASEAINKILDELARDHPALRLWAVPNGLVLMDKVNAVDPDEELIGNPAVTAKDDAADIERALRLKPE